MVKRTRELKNERSIERQYYIMSIGMDLPQFAYAVRAHWGIENNLHWVLDVVFRDDENRVQQKTAAMNMAIIKRAALNLMTL